jgi:glucose repression regulatory protein TUP1
MPMQQYRPGAPQPPGPGNTLADIDVETLSPQFKKEGDDWYCVFNPEIRNRPLDIELVQTLTHRSVVCCVRFSADGRYVATGCNRIAQIFEVESGHLVATLQDSPPNDENDLYIRSVCFSPDGQFLATGAEDKVIRVWNIREQKVVNYFRGHEQDIYSLDYAKSGRMIASGSGDRTVRLWDLDSGNQVLQLLIDDGVTTVAISPDCHFVAAGSLDKSVRVWDIQGNLVQRLEGEFGHKDSVYSVAWSPDSTKLVSGSLDKTIKMWDVSGPHLQGRPPGRCLRTFEGHKVSLFHP